MSRRKRRTFTTEQKAQAVRLAQDLGSIAEAARDLDLTESSLTSWIKQAKIDEGSGTQPHGLPLDIEAWPSAILKD